MIRLFLLQVIARKFVTYVGLCFILLGFQHLVAGQDNISLHVSEKSTTITDTFFIEIGSVEKNKFYEVSVQTRTSFGFFRQKKVNSFFSDTLYCVLTKGDNWFLKILDSMAITYNLQGYRRQFMDSLGKKYYNTRRINILDTQEQNKRRKRSYKTFIKIKATITYNNSFMKQNYVGEAYAFNKEGHLIKSKGEFLVYLPIQTVYIFD